MTTETSTTQSIYNKTLGGFKTKVNPVSGVNLSITILDTYDDDESGEMQLLFELRTEYYH